MGYCFRLLSIFFSVASSLPLVVEFVLPVFWGLFCFFWFLGYLGWFDPYLVVFMGGGESRVFLLYHHFPLLQYPFACSMSSMEPNVGLELMTLKSRPGLRSSVRCLTDWDTQVLPLPLLFVGLGKVIGKRREMHRWSDTCVSENISYCSLSNSNVPDHLYISLL